jgi:hypothetical protein
MPSPASIFDDSIDPNRKKVYKRSRGRPRTRALKSPNRCAPGVKPSECRSRPECRMAFSSDTSRRKDFCRKKTNKRRRA